MPNCPICKNHYEVVDTKKMTDEEYFIYFWEDTLGRDGAISSWKEKQENRRLTAPMVQSDIPGYISQIDGSWIDSRSKHRTHLKDHNMIELGNDVPMKHKDVEISRASEQHRKEAIARQVYEKLRY